MEMELELAKHKWTELDIDDQMTIISAFISSLTYGYQRRFFKRLSIDAIIKERWFQQYLVSIRNPLWQLFDDYSMQYEIAG